MTEQKWLALEPRERDAVVAEARGWERVGDACTVYVEGEQSVHVGSNPDGWMCYADKSAVFKEDYWESFTWEKYRPEEHARIDEYAESRDGRGRREWTAEEIQEQRDRHDEEYVGGIHQAALRAAPFFSQDIAAAWQLVEEMREWTHLPDGRACDLCVKVGLGDFGAFVEIHEISSMGYEGQDSVFTDLLVGDYRGQQGLTAPLAVCLAYLKAKGMIE